MSKAETENPDMGPEEFKRINTVHYLKDPLLTEDGIKGTEL